MAKYKTSELIEYISELLSFHRTNVNSREKNNKLEEIKNRLLELDKTKEDLIKFFGRGEVKFE